MSYSPQSLEESDTTEQLVCSILFLEGGSYWFHGMWALLLTLVEFVVQDSREGS